MPKQSFRKADVEFHSDGFRPAQVAVNIKVYGWWRQVPLPLDLGRYSDDQGATWHDVRTHVLFTHEWIEDHVTDEDLSMWFDEACQANLEQVLDYAAELYPGRKFWQEGCQGGWLVMDRERASDVAAWDALEVSTWGRLAKYARVCADDVPRAMLDLVYINVFDAWREAQQERELEIAEVAGGVA